MDKRLSIDVSSLRALPHMTAIQTQRKILLYNYLLSVRWARITFSRNSWWKKSDFIYKAWLKMHFVCPHSCQTYDWNTREGLVETCGLFQGTQPENHSSLLTDCTLNHSGDFSNTKSDAVLGFTHFVRKNKLLTESVCQPAPNRLLINWQIFTNLLTDLWRVSRRR
jgi:hypothetical protein